MTKKVRRNTQEELTMLKKQVIDKCVNKEIKCKDGAKLLEMHPKAFSRLKSRYKEEGISALVPRKTGPKENNEPYNKTEKKTEDIVAKLARENPCSGPMPLSEKLFDEYNIELDQSTIWRILKRKEVRYTREYKRWKKEPKLYCLDEPGIEIQIDGCYPYGRARRLVLFDAIDDCSRYTTGKLYNRETTTNIINFIKYLIRKAPYAIKKIRVDNKYSHELDKFCKSLTIELHKNDPYSPEQNGKIERFHRTIKHEFFWRYCSFHDSKELLQYKLNQYLDYYNTKRRHGGYGMNRLTPAQKIASTYFNSLSFIYPQKVTGTLQQYKIYPNF